MRIIVAGPPKTGNIWIKCLLAEIYGLEIVYNPPRNDTDLDLAVKDGWFADGTIFHQHYGPTPLFLDVASALDCKLVTIIRNPYDTFNSLYHFVQNFPKQFSHPPNPLHRIFGKPIDHPEVYAFLRDTASGFGAHILAAKKWVESGRSIILRYEDLQAAPLETLSAVAARIRPVDATTAQSALQACTAEKMRKLFFRYNRHIREGKVGGWRSHLNGAHLEAIKTHSPWIRALGYEVLEPENTANAG